MKYCVECTYFHIGTFWEGTDITPGWGWEMTCSMDVWKFHPRTCDTSEYRRMMMCAETCPHYKPEAFVTRPTAAATPTTATTHEAADLPPTPDE